MVSVFLGKNFVNEFKRLSKGVRLIWVLGALAILLFTINFMEEGTRPGVFVSSQSQKQVLRAKALTGEQLAQVNSSIVQASPVQANPAPVQQQGQVKGVSAVSIPASAFSGVYSHVVWTIYGCSWPGCPYYNAYDPVPPKIGADIGGSYRTWVKFSLAVLPPGQTVFSARLRNSPLSCGSYTYNSVNIGPYANYTFYFSPLGIRDPSTDSYYEQITRSGGSDSWNGAPWRPFAYNGGTCPSLASLDLGTWAASDITAAKPLANRFSFGINGTFVSGGWGYSQPLGTNFWLDLTYGIPSVDLKVNGSDGPVTVKGGTNIALTWEYLGYDDCRYNASPAWYTSEWPIGQPIIPSSGTANTKIYYENVTYSVNCRNSSSGATKSDSVTVNVTS